MTKSAFYLSPGLTLEERAEKIANRPCYCADPEGMSSCEYCFALAHLKAAVEEVEFKLKCASEAVDRWKDLYTEEKCRSTTAYEDRRVMEARLNGELVRTGYLAADLIYAKEKIRFYHEPFKTKHCEEWGCEICKFLKMEIS